MLTSHPDVSHIPIGELYPSGVDVWSRRTTEGDPPIADDVNFIRQFGYEDGSAEFPYFGKFFPTKKYNSDPIDFDEEHPTQW